VQQISVCISHLCCCSPTTNPKKLHLFVGTWRRRLFTAHHPDVLVQFEGSPCGTCGGEGSNGVGLSRGLRVSPVVHFTSALFVITSSGLDRIDRSTKGQSLTSLLATECLQNKHVMLNGCMS
jgi:hypothetical protein